MSIGRHFRQHFVAYLALFVALSSIGYGAPTALAAPPPNDNRDNAQVLPTFPAVTEGTTVDATVERLDPQRSPCGRVDATVWYRIESAPDGTVVASVQASGALAPVVHIYRRNPSNIAEVACGTGKAGGKAVASVAAVRGAGYLILVGHKPGTPNGDFQLRADLILPPDNDDRNEASALGRLPTTIRGSTLGATSDNYSGCGMSGGGVWYRFRGPATGRAIVQLAAGERDGVVAAFHRIRGDVREIGCQATDRHGRAVLGFATERGDQYLLLVGDRAGSSPGEFTLTIRPGEAPERLPGHALPHGGVRGSVDGLTDVNDIWSMRLAQGRTYRISFSSAPCAVARLRRGSSVLRSFNCRGYTTFTPGETGGGRYAVEVEAPPGTRRQVYRLQVVAAQADDLGVGVEIVPGSARRGRLSPSGVDVVDLYHFAVLRPSEARLRLAHGSGSSFELLLLTDSGNRLASGQTTLRRRLGRGRYVIAVQAPPGTSSGSYRLSLRLRSLTSTSVLVSGRSATEVTPGTTVSISCTTSPAPSGGRIELRIDRFDTLTGWSFYRVIRIPVAATVSWLPPEAGRWRVRAHFLGTRGSAPSTSGFAYVLVAKPLG
jgi:hypothetical protein